MDPNILHLTDAKEMTLHPTEWHQKQNVIQGNIIDHSILASVKANDALSCTICFEDSALPWPNPFQIWQQQRPGI